MRIISCSVKDESFCFLHSVLVKGECSCLIGSLVLTLECLKHWRNIALRKINIIQLVEAIDKNCM